MDTRFNFVWIIYNINYFNMTTIQKQFCQLILKCQWAAIFTRYNPCLAPDIDYDDQHLSNFLENFKEHSHYEDYYFGEAYLLQYIDPDRVNEYIVLRRIKNTDSVISEIEYNKCLKRKQLSHANIINLLQLGKKKGQGFIFTTYNVYAMYDYILVDLQRQFVNRISEKRGYEQTEIILILKQCIEGIQYLAKNKIQHGSIRLRNIYISNRGQFKLGYRELFDYETNLERVKNNQSHLIYLSPPQMEQLKKNAINQKRELIQKNIDNQNSTQFEKLNSIWKPSERNSNIYSLGMCLLTLMHGVSSLDYIFNYKNFTIDHIKLDMVYKRISSKYSERLLRLIKYMLDFSNYQQLEEFIAKLNLKTTEFRLTLLNETDIKKQQKVTYYDLLKSKKSTINKHPNHLSKILYPNVTSNEQLPSLKSKSKSNFGINTGVSSLKVHKSNKIQYASGGQFIGNVEGQERNGRGLYKHGDGQYYIGDWKNNKMHGKGWLYWSPQKIRYEGGFQNDHFHGYGIQYPKQFPKIEVQPIDIYIKKNNWKKYVGNFNQDNREGKGVIHFLNGYWEGNFKNNQPNGQGVWHPTGENKQIIIGRWTDGELD